MRHDLSITSLTVGYQGSAPVIHDLSTTLRAGEVVAIVGPNGGGKTTLLRAVLGLLAPSAGAVRLGGEDVGAMLAARRAERLAYVAQSPSIAFGFSVDEALRLGTTASGAGRDAVQRVRGLFGIDALGDGRVDRLSAGQRHRVAIGRATAQLLGVGAGRSRFLLADEPVGPLDPVAAVRMLTTLRGLASGDGLGVVLVMHDLSLARRFADRALLLSCEGRLVADAPVAEALTTETLGEVFGGSFVEAGSPSGAVSLIADA